MSYILNSDGKSELLDASYIIVPQNDSLFAIVKNNNVTDLKELTIEEFLTSELKETDCLLMYSAKEKKIKAVNIPRNNAEYLVKRSEDNVTLTTGVSSVLGTNYEPLMFIFNSNEYKHLNETDIQIEVSSGKYLVHTTISLYNENIGYLDDVSDIIPLKYYLRMKAGSGIVFDAPLLNTVDPMLEFHQSRLVEIEEDCILHIESNYEGLAILPHMDAIIIVLQRLNWDCILCDNIIDRLNSIVVNTFR